MKQYVARHSFDRGASQARKLIAQRAIPASVFNATFHLNAENAERGSIQKRFAAIDFQRGGLVVRQDEYFYLVESAKFVGRFYVVIEHDGQWFSSADCTYMTAQLVKQVEAYRKEQEAAKAASSNPHAAFNALCAKFAEEAAKEAKAERQAAVVEAERQLQEERKAVPGKYHAGMFNFRGASVYISDEEMKEIKARVAARRAVVVA